MSRTFVYSLLKTDANSTSLGSLGDIGLKPDNIYGAGVDTPQGEVFLAIRFGAQGPGHGPSNKGLFTIWAYDRNSDYLRIDQMLKRCRELLDSVSAQKTTEGWITTIDWESESEDLADDVYRASARNATFAIVSSGR